MRYIFFSFSIKKAFSIKKNQYNFFFHIKLFFSANNVDFVKNTNIFSKKIFFFQLSFATNEQPYLTALYEYHRPRHNIYRNKQIIQVYFAGMSPANSFCQYLSLLIHCLFLTLEKHHRHLYSVKSLCFLEKPLHRYLFCPASF